MKLYSTQFTVDELIGVFRRRRKLFFLPLVIAVVFCTVIAFVLPRRYESSTTILVQRDEVLNPLVNFTMAVSLASVDRLKALEEIIYSRPTIEKLLDTLGLRHDDLPVTETRVRETIKNIEISRKGEDSFTLGYLDTDPRRAQQAAAFLAEIFITMRLKVENQRNEYAVEFYENKLEDLRKKFETSQGEVIATLRKRINEMPLEGRSLYSHVEQTEQSIGGIEEDMKVYQRALTELRRFPDDFGTTAGTRAVLDLQRGELPFAGELGTLSGQYDDLAARYTPQYPEVQKLKNQILDLLDRMRTAVESEVARQQKKLWDLERVRNQRVTDLRNMSIADKQDQEQKSNFSIYQNLYDEMKIKLEQARTNRDLAKKATDQFIVIDPAEVPSEPSKPNRLLIILGGIGLGLFLGALAAGVGELTDTRVRAPLDVEGYGQPVIAYLPDLGR